MTEQAAAVLAIANDLFGPHSEFSYNTDVNPYKGGEYRVYALLVEQGDRRVCFRIPKRPYNANTRFLVEQEILFRGLIDAGPIKCFTRMLASDPTADNPLKTCYLILEWAHGDSMRWSDLIPARERHRRKVLYAIANVSLDLLGIQKTSGPAALEWITARIDRKIARAQAGTYNGTLTSCQEQKELISKYWIPELDASPHVFVHGDISGNNIIVDFNYDVQSVIDFGWAEYRPLQFAAEYPKFLTHEPTEDAEGAVTWRSADSAQMREDRAFYLSCIEARAKIQGGIVQDYYKILARPDEVARYWWYVSAGWLHAHRAMSACGWEPPVK